MKSSMIDALEKYWNNRTPEQIEADRIWWENACPKIPENSWISIEDHLPQVPATDAISHGGKLFLVKNEDEKEFENWVGADTYFWKMTTAKDLKITHWFNN